MHQKLADDVDEIQAERDLFWTVAYLRQPNPPKLEQLWDKMLNPQELEFADFYAHVETLCDLIGTEVSEEEIEVYVAKQIWIDKCTRGLDAFADRTIGQHLLSNYAYLSLHQTKN